MTHQQQVDAALALSDAPASAMGRLPQMAAFEHACPPDLVYPIDQRALRVLAAEVRRLRGESAALQTQTTQ